MEVQFKTGKFYRHLYSGDIYLCVSVLKGDQDTYYTLVNSCGQSYSYYSDTLDELSAKDGRRFDYSTKEKFIEDS